MEKDYFVAGLYMEANRTASVKTTQIMHNDYNDIFTGIGYFEGKFSLQIKNDARSYDALPRCVACTHQERFRNKQERLQEQEIFHH